MILHAIVAGQGTPVILLHGLFGRAQNLGSIARHLAQRHRVLSLDLRNHGGSPHHATMDYVSMAGDVMETMVAHDARPCVLLGHSMGGKVAMTVALTQPAAVARLILADIAPVAYAHGNAAVARALQGLVLEKGLTRAQADCRLQEHIPDPAVRSFLLQNLVLSPVPAWRIGLDGISAALADIEGFDGPPAAATYAGPTLFVRGERSDYITPACRPAILARFPAAQCATVENAGHWLHADQPAAFAHTVDAFLQPNAWN